MNRGNTMSRMLMLTAAAALFAAPALARAPQETPIALGEGAAALHGTLLAPQGGSARPPILLIAGSGATDRDGNSPMGVKAQPYKLLAQGLAARGLTTLRYDKRGIAASRAAAAGGQEDARLEHYAADAAAWARRLHAETGAPCVWLLGHSEGALLAEMAAQENPGVCGLVLVSGMGRKMADVLREQLRSNPANAPLLAQALPAVDALEAGRTVDSSGFHPALQPLFHASLQPFMMSMMRPDPAALLRKVDKPVLVLQGTTDLQTTVADAERLAGAGPHVRLVKLEGVNHVLKSAPADRPKNAATYADPDLPLAPGVVEAVADFVLANSPRRAR